MMVEIDLDTLLAAATVKDLVGALRDNGLLVLTTPVGVSGSQSNKDFREALREAIDRRDTNALIDLTWHLAFGQADRRPAFASLQRRPGDGRPVIQ